jgi:hypothetical protein
MFPSDTVVVSFVSPLLYKKLLMFLLFMCFIFHFLLEILFFFYSYHNLNAISFFIPLILTIYTQRIRSMF